MNKKLENELIISYEDLILEFSRKMLWLIKTEHGKRYQFAVHDDMLNRTMERLGAIHDKLRIYSRVCENCKKCNKDVSEAKKGTMRLNIADKVTSPLS